VYPFSSRPDCEERISAVILFFSQPLTLSAEWKRIPPYPLISYVAAPGVSPLHLLRDGADPCPNNVPLCRSEVKRPPLPLHSSLLFCCLSLFCPRCPYGFSLALYGSRRCPLMVSGFSPWWAATFSVPYASHRPRLRSSPLSRLEDALLSSSWTGASLPLSLTRSFVLFNW